MRRLLFTVLASAALLAIGPADAFAKHHSRHHRSHARHARIRHKRFGTDPGAVTNPAAASTAGTVDSFIGGVLTIKLNDGSTHSGKVTDATEIECEVADQDEAVMQGDMRRDGGSGGNDGGDGGDGRGDQEGQNQQRCDTSSLVAGAVVREAELRISAAGDVWDKVELQS
jgi:hypothetical protein